jgi:hypothetical protein
MGNYFTKPVKNDFMIRISKKFKQIDNVTIEHFTTFLNYLVSNKIDNEYNKEEFDKMQETHSITIDMTNKAKDDRLKKLYRSSRNVKQVYYSFDRYGIGSAYDFYADSLFEPYLVQDTKVIDVFTDLDLYFSQICSIVYVNNREERNKYAFQYRIYELISSNFASICNKINILSGNMNKDVFDDNDIEAIKKMKDKMNTLFDIFINERDRFIDKIENKIEGEIEGLSPIKYSNTNKIYYYYINPTIKTKKPSETEDFSFHNFNGRDKNFFYLSDSNQDNMPKYNNFNEIIEEIGFEDEDDCKKNIKNIIDIYLARTSDLRNRLEFNINNISCENGISCYSALINIKYYLNAVKRAIKFRIDEFCYRYHSNYRWDFKHSKYMSQLFREFYIVNIEDLMKQVNTAISKFKIIYEIKNEFNDVIQNIIDISSFHKEKKELFEEEIPDYEVQQRALNSLNNDVNEKYSSNKEFLQLLDARVKNDLNMLQ